MLRLATDEDVHGAIITGVRRRVPGIDLVRVQDAGMDHTPDPTILEWAAAQGRILVTEDVNTMVGFAWDRVARGLPMPGVIARADGVTVRQAIDSLELAVCCGVADDFKDQVVFMPIP
jgi:predicted nuclease of predicted toxin-antitoxin system